MEVLLLGGMITVVLLCFLYIVRSMKRLRSRQQQAEALARAKMMKVVQAHESQGKKARQ